MKRISFKNMTDEEKKAKKRKQKNEAQKRYYQKHKEYYINYNKEHNYYKDKYEELKTILDNAIEITNNLLKTEKSGYYQILFKKQLEILKGGDE